jgi:hypothetical protein
MIGSLQRHYILWADIINNMGVSNNNLGRNAEAIYSYEYARKIYDRKYGGDRIRSAGVINNLGLL